MANNPADGFNGVVAFNDRDGEAQLNQLWLTMARETHTGGNGFDIGGRMDFIFGSDARFMEATDGFEHSWNQTSRFYHAAIPQVYVDVAIHDWVFRFGKWFTFLEYEEDEAINNFFYSHSYAKVYGKPFLHTGALAIGQLTDQLEFKAGLHRGWNQFDDTDGLDDISFIGGFKWTNVHEDVELRWGITAGEQSAGNDTVLNDFVAILRLTEDLQYVWVTDIGSSRGGSDSQFEPGEWYGIVNYLYYEMNSKWTAGIRTEWFRDDDGVRVAVTTSGNETHHGEFEGNFYEISLGLNYTHCENLRIRPELRWDWFEGEVGSHGFPFDAGDKDEQFMAAIDFILLL